MTINNEEDRQKVKDYIASSNIQDVLQKLSTENQHPEDVIDGRGEDDGFLSSVIEKAQAFSEDMLSIYPMFHPDLPQHEVDRIRQVVQSYSYVGFRRGYLEGYNDAKQQEK
jgi:hypothetical protein